MLRVLAIAADWRDVEPRSVAAVVADPAVAHYAPDWRDPKGDRGLVAEDLDTGPIGAVWWRFFPADDPGYGFVAADVPELSIGVLPGHRCRGIGTALLQQIVDRAKAEGLRGLSLSVHPGNPAVGLYTRLGFVPVHGSGGALTMLRSLSDRRA